jgi:hypothetical protein
VTVSADSTDAALEEPETEPFTYGSTDSGSSRSMAAIAGGVALLVIIAGGLWFALSSGSNATSQPIQIPVASQAVEQSPEPTQPDPAVQQAAVSVEEAPVEAVSQPEVPVTAGDPGTTRVASKPIAGKAPKPVSSPAKEPVKKKALTVDDLIRDN